jgi:predicted esterase
MVKYIHSLLHEEMKILPAGHIILGGTNQGFAVASHTLISFRHALGGFIGMSGWIPFQKAPSGPGKLCSNLLGMDFVKPECRSTLVHVSHSKDD